MTNIATPILGHEAKWQALQRAFVRGQIPQTLLISGAAQVGKWTLARRFAQLLLCPNTNQSTSQSTSQSTLPEPCGTCRVCHQIEIETFPDFRVFRPIVGEAKDEKDWIPAPSALEGSIITVEMARKFGDEAMRKPLAGPRKVMIIEQAERMNIAAQNALLKTFEEPVKGLSIVFLCENPSQLLATVRSRCWHLPLGLVSDEVIARWLQELQPNLAAEQVEQAVRIAAGRPGAAWREVKRWELQHNDNVEDEAVHARGPRFMQAMQMIERIARAQPVAALGLTEESLKLAKQWWSEDLAVEPPRAGSDKEAKKAEAKVARSSVARFLDELSNAYRVRWQENLSGRRNDVPAAVWADGLDQIRKTRHYILRNANTNLALDVMFGRLIAAQAQAKEQSKTLARPNERSRERPLRMV